MPSASTTTHILHGCGPGPSTCVEAALWTLFCILVVNNWFVVVEGFAAVADRDVARVYFLSFYVIGVLLFLNIVVAFILDAFLSEYNKARSSRGW